MSADDAARTTGPCPLPHADGVHHLTLNDGQAVVCKRRHHAPDGFFPSEALGLDTLCRHGGLRVPQVVACTQTYILIEDLGHGSPAADFFVRAGLGLARQHLVRSHTFGFSRDGWCGDSPQSNARDSDGWRFFAEARLLPQIRHAVDAGLLTAHDADAGETLCTHLHEWIPEQPAVLLHGDLWSGNLHSDRNGAPALIDAGAVHYGWGEAELAMLTLFGSPPAAFFDSYAQSAPLAEDWRERIPLYNLYHLLNHLNLFGTSYLDGVRQILRRFG